MTAATILWPAMAGLHGLMVIGLWRVAAAAGIAAAASGLEFLAGRASRRRRQ